MSRFEILYFTRSIESLTRLNILKLNDSDTISNSVTRKRLTTIRIVQLNSLLPILDKYPEIFGLSSTHDPRYSRGIRHTPKSRNARVEKKGTAEERLTYICTLTLLNYISNIELAYISSIDRTWIEISVLSTRNP